MKHNKIKIAAIGLVALASAILPSAGVFAATQSVNTTINGTILAMISIASTGSSTPVAFSVTPGGSALMSSANDTVTITTNSATGYNLNIKDADASLNLVSGANTITPTTGTAAAPAVMAVNSWGYRVDNGASFGAGPTTALNSQAAAGTWAGITATDVLIFTENVPANAKAIPVWFGMNVNATKPTGTYTDVVTYTAVTK